MYGSGRDRRPGHPTCFVSTQSRVHTFSPRRMRMRVPISHLVDTSLSHTLFSAMVWLWWRRPTSGGLEYAPIASAETPSSSPAVDGSQVTRRSPIKLVEVTPMGVVIAGSAVVATGGHLSPCIPHGPHTRLHLHAPLLQSMSHRFIACGTVPDVWLQALR